MRWQSGCKLRGEMPKFTYLNLSMSLFITYFSPTPKFLTPLASSQLSTAPSRSTCKDKSPIKSHDLLQFSFALAPRRRNIYARSLLPRWLIKPSNPNPPRHIPLIFTRPAQHNHNIINLDPAHSSSEFVRDCACACLERVCGGD